MRFDSSDFARLRKDYDQSDTIREKVVASGRKLIKASKQLIYSLHREDFAEADRLLKQLEAARTEMVRSAKTAESKVSGAYRSALQEHVEAATFHSLVRKGTLPTAKALKVDTDSYLLGICDLTGELGRLAVHSASRNDIKRFNETRDFVDKIYGELLKFDFRNSELRRKYDSVKYTVNKLEDIELNLALRERR